jgi:hypothetical protein
MFQTYRLYFDAVWGAPQSATWHLQVVPPIGATVVEYAGCELNGLASGCRQGEALVLAFKHFSKRPCVVFVANLNSVVREAMEHL